MKILDYFKNSNLILDDTNDAYEASNDNIKISFYIIVDDLTFTADETEKTLTISPESGFEYLLIYEEFDADNNLLLYKSQALLNRLNSNNVVRWLHASSQGITWSGTTLICGYHKTEADATNSAKISIAKILSSNSKNEILDLFINKDGYGNSESGLFSHCEGYMSMSTGMYSHAEGQKSQAAGACSHAEGGNAISAGSFSHCEGNNNAAMALCSHAEGNQSQAKGQGSHVEGVGNLADTQATAAHSEGYQTTVTAQAAHAEGQGTKATAIAAHAEGYETEANGQASHAGGYQNIVDGDFSVAFGENNYTIGSNNFISGNLNILHGERSLIFGKNNIISNIAGTATILDNDRTKISLINTIGSGITVGSELFFLETMSKKNVVAKETDENNKSIYVLDSAFPENITNVTFTCLTETSIQIKSRPANNLISGLRNHITTRGSGIIVFGQDNSISNSTNSIVTGKNNITNSYFSDGIMIGNNNICNQTSGNTIVLGKYNSANYVSNGIVLGTYNNTFTDINKTSFVIGGGTDASSRANVFRISKVGEVYGYGAYNSSGADYAEYFEWLDRNENNEDRRGLFVTLNEDKIVLADDNSDFILGIVSGAPTIIGDSYEDQWQGMFMKDIFGTPIMETVTIPAEFDDEGNEIIPEHEETREKLNPDYQNQKYIPRSERSEWSPVGMMGKLVVCDNGTCVPNFYAKPTIGGIATMSIEKTKYRVLKRIDDTHVLILIL